MQRTSGGRVWTGVFQSDSKWEIVNMCNCINDM